MLKVQRKSDLVRRAFEEGNSRYLNKEEFEEARRRIDKITKDFRMYNLARLGHYHPQGVMPYFYRKP
ncbi:MAG TPA: hypothetical protein VMC80_00560 [Patescibacteria group bacterium]|nr:hypothetical protein [Patescibacteria group bacterium]